MAPQPSAEEESGEGLDLDYAKDVAGLLIRAPRRHRKTAMVAFAGVAFLSIIFAIVWPRTYQVDVTILTQRTQVMSTLVNPNVQRANNEASMHAIEEIIRRHDSVVAVVKEANVLDLRAARRPWALRIKDKLQQSVLGSATEEEQVQALVALFEKKLVFTADDSTIHLMLEWDDPDLALKLINTTVDDFLDGRNAADVAVIAETITILEGEAKKSGGDVDAALAEVIRLEQDAKPGVAPSPSTLTAPKPAIVINPAPVQPQPSGAPAPKSNKGNLAEKLAEKRKQIRELDEPRQRKIAELKAQIADLELTYAPAHPSVIAAQQKLTEASVEPPELSKLKQEEQALLTQGEDTPSEYDESAPPPKPMTPKPLGSPVVGMPKAALSSGDDKEPTPELLHARAKLASAATKYQDLLNRIDSARIEMLTAQAAFKYRYSVSQPAEFPKKPKKPNVVLLLLGGIFGAMVLAILAAAARDAMSGRFIEAWQVKRKLKLPVLARVRAR